MNNTICQELGNPMTVKEIAEYLKVSPNVIYKMVNNGEIPFLRVGPRHIRFFPAAIKKWANESSK